MRALELDYLQIERRTLWMRSLLGLLAVVFAADTSNRYLTLKTETELKARAIARTVPVEKILRPTPNTPLNPEEYDFARQTVEKLATPWDSLFKALEAAHSDRIVLLAVEPDAGKRIVRMTGEAKDYLAALTYVASLAQQDSLQRVYLEHHEYRRGGSPTVVAFSISAAWRDAQ